MQLQLYYTNCTTPKLQLHYTTTTTTASLHHTTSSSCGWGDRPGDHCNHCNHSKKHNSNHLSVHQWIHPAIRDSRQPTPPIGFLFLKLPPPPCAVLPVLDNYSWIYVSYPGGSTQRWPGSGSELCSPSGRNSSTSLIKSAMAWGPKISKSIG